MRARWAIGTWLVATAAWAQGQPESEEQICLPGQEITVDTAGRCCWPGQVWTNERCVGVPTRCPEGWHAEASRQICAPKPCPPGQVHTENQARCCWPGQAWSVLQKRCVGVPNCPERTEPSGETCVPSDPDNDGLVNKVDRCPKEAEDRDGHQDQDGCPDPDNDADGLLDAADRCPAKAEDKNGFEDEDGCPDADRFAALTAAEQAKRRREAEEKERERLVAERREAEQRRRAASNAERESAQGWRTTGWISIGVGGALLATSGLFLHLGNQSNSRIQEGGLASGRAIREEADAGQSRNTAAIVFGVLGGAAVGFGAFAVLLNPDPGEKSVSTKIVVSPTGLAFGGAF